MKKLSRLMPKKECADALIEDLEKRFTIEDEGDITNYLGINITTPDANTVPYKWFNRR